MLISRGFNRRVRGDRGEKKRMKSSLKLSVLGVLERSGRLIKAYERPVVWDFEAVAILSAFGFRSRRSDQPMLAARFSKKVQVNFASQAG